MGLGLLSLVLMFVDSRFDYLQQVRYYTAIAVTPLHLMADLPVRVGSSVADFFRARDHLAAENVRLQDELLTMQFKLQKFEHLVAENQRLNDLLKASSIVDDEAVRAQLVGGRPDPFTKRVLINKGSNEGVFVGQPVVDAYGLMGQIVEVEPLTSWVLLITDPQHSTPVQVNRNGVRAIATGTADSLDQLTLENITSSADIVVGDVLVASGLDQRFPVGYPVGVVASVENNNGEMFSKILVTPTAQLDRSRNVLLLFSSAGALIQPPIAPTVVPTAAPTTAPATAPTTTPPAPTAVGGQ
jgi:rod shape-determining protein MreC